MPRQFKVGDIVHIKSAGHLELQYGMINSGIPVRSPIRGTDETFCKWNGQMFDCCGKEAVIKARRDYGDSFTYDIRVDDYESPWAWSPQSFEEYDMEVEE